MNVLFWLGTAAALTLVVIVTAFIALVRARSEDLELDRLEKLEDDRMLAEFAKRSEDD